MPLNCNLDPNLCSVRTVTFEASFVKGINSTCKLIRLVNSPKSQEGSIPNCSLDKICTEAIVLIGENHHHMMRDYPSCQGLGQRVALSD